MLFKAYIVACLLQLCSAAAAPPNGQQPLVPQVSKTVQEVRAEQVLQNYQLHHHSDISRLKKAEIIPTVINDFLPSLTLTVHWNKYHAKLGNTLKAKKLRKTPAITLHDITAPEDDNPTSTSNDMKYVVTLTDPDAPSRDNPKWSEFCHWIAANVSLSSSSENTYSILPLPEHGLTKHDKTDLVNVVPYKPPTPPKKTGKHRYVFLVFAPRNGTTEPLHLSAPSERRHWGTGRERAGVKEWAWENGLVPVAANFVYAQHKKQ